MLQELKVLSIFCRLFSFKSLLGPSIVLLLRLCSGSKAACLASCQCPCPLSCLAERVRWSGSRGQSGAGLPGRGACASSQAGRRAQDPPHRTGAAATGV